MPLQLPAPPSQTPPPLPTQLLAVRRLSAGPIPEGVPLLSLKTILSIRRPFSRIHTSKLCSTGGATDATITPGNGSVYYLVVPNNGVREGGYGFDSGGDARPQGLAACLPRSAGTCI